MNPYTWTKLEMSKSLALAFPGQEFSITTSKGMWTRRDSQIVNVSVNWINGPTVEDVSIVIDNHLRHQLTEWSRGSMWSVSRELSSDTLAALLAEYHIVRNWDGRITNVKHGRVEFHSADNASEFWRMASQRSFYGRKLAAAELAGDYEAMLAYRDF